MKRLLPLAAVLIILVLVQLACNAPVPIPMTGASSTPGITGTPGVGQVGTPGTPGANTTPGAGDGAPCTYRATFVEDVTVPDNTTMQPGQAFTKTWRVKNDGTCTWGPLNYAFKSVAFISGDQMGAPGQVPLPKEVKPGETVDVSVPMTAPTNAGSYIGQWMFKVENDPNFAGPNLGVGQDGKGALYVQILVK